MKKTVYILLALIGISAISGYFLYQWLLGKTEPASAPITATEIRETTITAPSEATKFQTLEIAQEVSEARFIIFEELRGEPVNVVGATDQVAAQLRIDLDDLSRMQLGPVQINARTFVTDTERRDRAIRNRILHTDDHEFITFTPTSLENLSGSAEIGDTVQFSAEGDLDIRGIVQPVRFEITMQIIGNDHITGTAETTVSREAFDLKVPDLPFLANVADEVRLEFKDEFRLPSDELTAGQ